MINHFMIIGRIANDIEKNNNIITVASTRQYKNENGEYETDYFDIIIKGMIAKTTTEYCKKGDIIGVKGNIRSDISNDIKRTILIAEKITFLSN